MLIKKKNTWLYMNIFNGNPYLANSNHTMFIWSGHLDVLVL